MNDQHSVASVSKGTTNKDSKKKESDHHELGIVPEDWKAVKLAEAAQIEMGSSPKSEFYNEDGIGLPFFQGNNEFGRRYPNIEVWCSEPVKVAEQDDILISVRAPVGDLNIAEGKSCIGRGLASISSQRFNREYLFYHLQERNKWLNRISAGSTYDSINSSQLKNLKLRYPSISEQRRIASVLYNVDQAIQKTEEIIEQTQRVKKGLMQDLFTEGYYNHEGFKETPTGRYPDDWEMVRAGDYLDLSNGEFLKSDDRDKEGEYPVYGGHGILGYTNEYQVEAKTVLIGRVGAYCGNVQRTDGKAWVTDNAIVVNEKKEYDADFLAYLLTDLNLGRLSEQSAQSRISQSTIENLKIPLPAQDEQQKIAEVMKDFENKISAEKAQKKKLQRNKKGLMQDLLTGKVRINCKDIEVLDEVLEAEKS